MHYARKSLTASRSPSLSTTLSCLILASRMDVTASGIFTPERAESLSTDLCFPNKVLEKLILEYAIDILPAAPKSRYFLGELLYDKKQYDEAMKYYDRALASNPEMSEIYFNKARRLHDITPNPDEAQRDQMIAYLDKCISLNPLFFKAYINKAALLREQGKEAEASEVLNEIVKPMFDTEYIMGIEQRGIAYRQTGELPKALNDFNFVLFYNPHNIQNLSNLAMVNLQMNNLGNADYYARIGLQEAEKQNNHSCDGDFYVVQQTLANFRNQMPFAFKMAQPSS